MRQTAAALVWLSEHLRWKRRLLANWRRNQPGGWPGHAETDGATRGALLAQCGQPAPAEHSLVVVPSRPGFGVRRTAAGWLAERVRLTSSLNHDFRQARRLGALVTFRLHPCAQKAWLKVSLGGRFARGLAVVVMRLRQRSGAPVDLCCVKSPEYR